jgi:hypothetical protein
MAEGGRGLIFHAVVGVPDDSPAPFEGAPPSRFPKGATARFEPVEQFRATVHLRRHGTWRSAESPGVDLRTRQQVYRICIKNLAIGIVIGRGYRHRLEARGMRGYDILGRDVYRQLMCRCGGLMHAFELDEVKNDVWDGIPFSVCCL